MGWHRHQHAGCCLNRFRATGECGGAGDDEEGLVVLAVHVLGRTRRRRRQRDLDDAEAMVGVGAVLEYPDREGTDGDDLALGQIDDLDRHQAATWLASSWTSTV